MNRHKLGSVRFGFICMLCISGSSSTKEVAKAPGTVDDEGKSIPPSHLPTIDPGLADIEGILRERCHGRCVEATEPRLRALRFVESPEESPQLFACGKHLGCDVGLFP